MSQTEGTAWVPTPDEAARVNILHADMLSKVKRLQDCADKLDAVLSNLEVSLCLRQEAASRILLCAGKLENIGSVERAVSLLDSIRRDPTLGLSLSVHEEAAKLIFLCAHKLADAGAEGRAMRLLDSIQRDETLSLSLREEADRLLLRISTQWSFRLNDLKKSGKPS